MKRFTEKPLKERSPKMRIAYVTMHWPRFAASGVGKKINRQIKAWRKAGHIVELFNHMHTFQDKNLLLEGNRFEYDFGKGFFGSLITESNRIKAAKALTKSVLEFHPDIVYLRWSIYTYPLHYLVRQIPTVLEINSVDTKEYRILGRQYHLYNKLTRSIILSRVEGFIFISEQISKMRDFKHYQKPSAIITNGVELDLIPVYPAPNNLPPHLLFIGTPGMAWHGVEKLIELAKHFPDLIVDIIGLSGFEKNNEIPENIIFHGYLTGEALENVMRKADAAIGSLSLHLIGLNERSTLKIPDYAAHGIPCILPHIDTDLTPLKSEYFLQIPNNAANIQTHGQTIRDFVYNMRGKRVPRGLIADHIDNKSKEDERLRFFGKILGFY